MNNTSNYIIIPFDENQDLEILKYNLVSNLTFKTHWSDLAKTLGFEISDSSSMNISRANSNYIIHEGTNPTETTFQMIVSDFSFEFLPDTISLGTQIIDNLTPEVLTTTTIENANNSSVKSTKTFSSKTSKKVTVSSSHKIANSLSVKKSYSTSIFMLSLKAEVNFKFSHQFTLGHQKATLESTQFIETITVSIPAKSRIPIKLIAYKTKITTPFTALVKINYKITFKGIVILINNVGIQQFPFEYTFGTDELSANEDLRNQYIQSNIPNDNNLPWNWNSFNSKILATFLPSLFKGFASQINGNFEKDDSSIINIEAGPPSKL